MALQRSHEQSIIDVFFDRFKDVAKKDNVQLFRCSLDGQDALTGADYLFTESTKFALVEFKYGESEIANEKNKPRRLALCRALDANQDWQNQHLSCHFIGWSSHNSNSRTISLNIYRHEVCHWALWGEKSELLLPTPKIETRIEADQFMVDFLNKDNAVGSSFENFKNYLNWLLNLKDAGNDSTDIDAGNDSTDVELLLYNPGDKRCIFHEFSSLNKLKIWFDTNLPRPTRRPRTGPSP